MFHLIFHLFFPCFKVYEDFDVLVGHVPIHRLHSHRELLGWPQLQHCAELSRRLEGKAFQPKAEVQAGAFEPFPRSSN